MSEAIRTDPDVVQFTVFIAPYHLCRVLMSGANRTGSTVAQYFTEQP
jgi:hypothetical protein